MRPDLSAISRRALAALALVAGLKALALVGIAEAVARGIVAAIEQDDAWRDALVLGTAAVVLRAASVWAGQWLATRATLGAKERLRRELAQRVLAGGGIRSGGTAVVGSLGLDELDSYFRTALPAMITTAVVPLLVGARILAADWVSALIIALTIPLVPVFMVLVGQHSQERADDASATLTRLSDHLVELAKGLPVLVGLGRAAEQADALRDVSERHRTATMLTLRSAFLSSLVLELIATISVAVVAVFVGVRLVAGDLPLEVGLVALVLAPECFTPFREVGSAFHASQDGLAALRRARAVIDEPASTDIRRPGRGLTVSHLTVTHDGRDAATLADVSFEVARGGTVSVEGPSGSGKSTLLGVLAGTVIPARGVVRGIDPASVAWVPQHPQTVADTVRGELELYADDSMEVERVSTLLGLDGLGDADPARLSPGELRRVAVARGLLRVSAGAEVLLLDEPTAHLDAGNAARVEAAIAALRGQVTIVLASHETGVTRLADQVVLLGARASRSDAADAASAAPVAAAPLEPLPAEAPGSARRGLRTLLAASRGHALASVVLGAAAASFAAALTALSGWLIVRAAEQPPIMYLLVAIVGVRFFGIGRAVLRYAERLVTHDAVLRTVTDLRDRLWRGLAARGIASRAFATGASALEHLVAAADRVRDLLPRVALPPLVAALTTVAALVATGVLYAPALPVLAALLLVALVGGPLVGLAADRSAAASTAQVRSVVLRRFAGAVTAADDLRANDVAERVLDDLDRLDTRAGALARRGSWALGAGQAFVALVCGLGTVAMIAVGAEGAASGALPDAILAVLVLLPLALIEPLTAPVDALQQWPTLRDALRKVDAVTDAPAERTSGTPAPRVTRLDLDALTVAWPGAPRPAFSALDASVERGGWLVAEGPSGSGKSTLLATLLGYLPAASGAWRVDGTDAAEFAPADLRARFAWCPQEAHLFDSSIRGNLALAAGRDADDDVLVEVVRRVGLGPLLERLPDGLDTRVGPGGSALSGGERQRLAVARTLLTDADVVLLDEPTAHLDGEAASALMADLRSALDDRIVVLVTHHADEVSADDARVRLGAAV